MEGNETIGYDLVNIETGEKKEFLRLTDKNDFERIGRFSICPDGLKMGEMILDSLVSEKKGVIILDEVGMLELQDRGWAMSISNILDHASGHILFSVRDIYVDKVLKKWNINNPVMIDIRNSVCQEGFTEMFG